MYKVEPLFGTLKKSNVVKNIFAQYSSRVWTMFLGFFSNIIISKSLSVTDYGLYSYFLTLIATLVQFGTMGIPSMVVRKLSRSGHLSGLILKNLFAVCCLVLFFYSCAFFILKGFYRFEHSENFHLIGLIFLGVLVFLMMQFSRSVLQGVGLFKKDALNISIARTASFSILVFLYLFNFVDIYSLIYVVILYTFLVVCLSISSMPNHDWFKKRVSKRVVFWAVRSGGKIYIVTTLSFLVLKVDLFFVEKFLSGNDLGYYSFAVSLIDYVYILPVIVSSVIFQRLSSELKNINRFIIFRKYLSIYVACYIVYLIFCSYSLAFIIELFYPKQYLPSVPIVDKLLFSIFFMGVSTFFQQVIVATEVTFRLVLIWFLGFSTNIILNFLFIEKYQLNAVIFATVLSYFFVMISSWYELRVLKFSGGSDE